MKTGRTIVNILKATMRGELLLSLKIDKIFMHITYLFVVVWFTIYISLKIEQTLTRVERNSAVLEDLRIYHAQKTGELAGFDRISTIEKMLKDSGSKTGLPEKPATHIK